MNPVFWFLIIVAAFCLWLAISFIFIPLGGILLKTMKRIFNINIENFPQEIASISSR